MHGMRCVHVVVSVLCMWAYVSISDALCMYVNTHVLCVYTGALCMRIYEHFVSCVCVHAYTHACPCVIRVQGYTCDLCVLVFVHVSVHVSCVFRGAYEHV